MHLIYNTYYSWIRQPSAAHHVSAQREPHTVLSPACCSADALLLDLLRRLSHQVNSTLSSNTATTTATTSPNILAPERPPPPPLLHLFGCNTKKGTQCCWAPCVLLYLFPPPPCALGVSCPCWLLGALFVCSCSCIVDQRSWAGSPSWSEPCGVSSCRLRCYTFYHYCVSLCTCYKETQ